MEKIQIPLIQTKTKHKTHDIETALAWSAIKKALHEAERDDLFSYIKSVKVTEKYVTIHTGKPLVNAEFLVFEKDFSRKLEQFFQNDQKKIRFI